MRGTCLPLSGYRPEGVYFDHNGSLCIPPDSSAWDLPPAAMLELLGRCRVLSEYRREAEAVYAMIDGGGEGVIPCWLLIRRRYRLAAERAGLNPFLTDADRAECARALDELRPWLMRRWKRRAARRRNEKSLRQRAEAKKLVAIVTADLRQRDPNGAASGLVSLDPRRLKRVADVRPEHAKRAAEEVSEALRRVGVDRLSPPQAREIGALTLNLARVYSVRGR
jgi:hypothetical protein